jgi:hypothetical protein
MARERDAARRAWQAALEDMNERLAAGWQALAAGRVDVAPFAPPSGLGPLPIELRALAEHVLEETRAFETALTQRSEAVARELVMARRASDEPAARPQFFDRAI